MPKTLPYLFIHSAVPPKSAKKKLWTKKPPSTPTSTREQDGLGFLEPAEAAPYVPHLPAGIHSFHVAPFLIFYLQF